VAIVLSKSPAKLWGDAFVSSGIRNVYRYTYGTRTAVPFISERQCTDLPLSMHRCNIRQFAALPQFGGVARLRM
jgi:hypothetical protein